MGKPHIWLLNHFICALLFMSLVFSLRPSVQQLHCHVNVVSAGQNGCMVMFIQRHLATMTRVLHSCCIDILFSPHFTLLSTNLMKNLQRNSRSGKM